MTLGGKHDNMLNTEIKNINSLSLYNSQLNDEWKEWRWDIGCEANEARKKSRQDDVYGSSFVFHSNFSHSLIFEYKKH